MKSEGKSPTKTRQRRYKGSGSIFYREDKQVWIYRVSLPPGLDGKRKSREVSGKTEGEVRRKIADLTAQGGGTIQPTDPTTLSEYAKVWLARKAKEVRPNTVEAYRWAWSHVEPIMGERKLDKFNRPTVVRFLDELKAGGATSYTCQQVCRVMHTLFEDAIARGHYNNGPNPFRLARGDKPKHRSEPGRALTVDECKRFKAAAREDWLEAAWIIGLNTGMRIGEIFGLQWDDIDFDKRTISVRRQATTPRGSKLEIGPLKTDDLRDSPREITPIGADTLAALERRRAAAAKEKPSIWVFASANPKQPISPHNARERSFNQIVTAAKIEVSPKYTRPGPFTPHDLRHTMNSLGAAARVSEQVLSERSGHANSTITRRYTHTYADQQRDAAESIESMTR